MVALDVTGLAVPELSQPAASTTVASTPTAVPHAPLLPIESPHPEPDIPGTKLDDQARRVRGMADRTPRGGQTDTRSAHDTRPRGEKRNRRSVSGTGRRNRVRRAAGGG
ncbi:hypothetical protein Acsp05_64060 [Actinokineospora sp. NBRC 105648]|nr:hypothetical protein Acsp05_64060 [Actinokineospora sp. NBRC 105648]